MNATFDQRQQRVEQQINVAISGAATGLAVSDAAYDFTALIDSTTRWFVGREALLDELSDFAVHAACGYFCIVADAGLGKTALAAEVARRLQAPAFFASAGRGLTRPDQCLKHLCGELITRYDLGHEYLPTRAGEDSAFLDQLLEEARAKKQPLWLVVDALDEADQAVPGRNPLLLPTRLPDGVYVLITQRPGRLEFQTDPRTPFVERAILADSQEQRADIARYLQLQAAQNPGVVAALAGARPPVATDMFVSRLAAASQGNFMVLEYYLRELEAGFSEKVDLDGLPSGLSGYYGGFWSTIEVARDQAGWHDWKRLYRPVVECLAVAAEPVTPAWLAEQIGGDADEIRERVLLPWRRLLSCEQSAAGETWRIVHRSFADFLAERVDLVAAHRAVGEHYLLRPSRWDAHGGYALRYLASHLRLAGEHEALFGLVDHTAWYEAQMAVDPGGAAYLHDLAQAWLAAEATQSGFVGRQLRCALASASMLSQSANLPPQLLTALLDAGQLTLDSALHLAARQPDPGLRCAALVALAGRNAAVLVAALAAARTIDNLGNRALALATVASQIDQPDRAVVAGEALALLEALEDPRKSARSLAILLPSLDRQAADAALANILGKTRALAGAKKQVRVLETLLPALPESRIDEVLAIARAIPRPGWRACAVGMLAARLPADQRQAVLEVALGDVRKIGDPVRRARGLTALVPGLDVFDEALAAARAIPTAPARTRALLALVPHMTEPEVRKEALAASRELADPRARIEALTVFAEPELVAEALASVALLPASDRQARWNALARLAPLLPERLLGQARATALAVGDNAVRARTLARLGAALHDADLRAETLAVVWRLPPGRDRGRAFAALVPYLGEPERTRAIAAALEDAASIQGSEDTASLLVALAPHCAERLMPEALRITEGIGNGGWRMRALVALAPYLPIDVLARARELAGQLVRPGWRAQALAALAPRFVDQVQLEMVHEARTALATVDGAEARSRALLAMLPVLAAEEQTQAVHQLVDVLPRLRPVSRWRAVAFLAPYLPAADRTAHRDELVEHLVPLAWTLDAAEDRAAALEALADCAQCLPTDRRLYLFKAALRCCAARGRPSLLDDLPALARLGGPPAALEAVRAIQATANWWP